MRFIVVLDFCVLAVGWPIANDEGNELVSLEFEQMSRSKTRKWETVMLGSRDLTDMRLRWPIPMTILILLNQMRIVPLVDGSRTHP
jgi:hypothetical protein